ncbi:hypothetical protein C3Y98_05655 [Methylotenera oryzisoli]|jgi:hypothetical protein|uniref:Uncharacterized protein n=1 Tax=Methylotenera oryzisoli TaxID=2080758 RepID=A0A4Y9VSK1_9PROT|nr:hypothetical protein C3Y98_05655 [Methylotenera oryzisoli]
MLILFLLPIDLICLLDISWLIKKRPLRREMLYPLNYGATVMEAQFLDMALMMAVYSFSNLIEIIPISN